MITLSAAAQRTLHTLQHCPNGLPLHSYRQGDGTAMRKRLLRTGLVEEFRGPDANPWMRLTSVGKAFCEAVKGDRR